MNWFLFLYGGASFALGVAVYWIVATVSNAYMYTMEGFIGVRRSDKGMVLYVVDGDEIDEEEFDARSKVFLDAIKKAWKEKKEAGE
jgi:hypothetical protein